MPQEPRLFDVHLYAVVRRKVPEVAAESPEAAIETALSHPTTARWLRMLEDSQGIGEFAEEYSHFLVDVVGDDEFEQSCWFHAAETPLLQILRTLIRWDDTGRSALGLSELLAEARHILSRSL